MGVDSTEVVHVVVVLPVVYVPEFGVSASATDDRGRGGGGGGGRGRGGELNGFEVHSVEVLAVVGGGGVRNNHPSPMPFKTEAAYDKDDEVPCSSPAAGMQFPS